MRSIRADHLERLALVVALPMENNLFAVRRKYRRERRSSAMRQVAIFAGHEVVQGEIRAGMVWSPALSQGRVEFPDGKFRAVPNYTPEPGLRWNIAIALPNSEPAMKLFLDDSIEELIKRGEMKKIVEHYGFPYFPPFE